MDSVMHICSLHKGSRRDRPDLSELPTWSAVRRRSGLRCAAAPGKVKPGVAVRCRSEVTMTTTVRAVYENGVLRPDRPLPLAEGQAVDVTVATSAVRPDDGPDEELTRRLRAARTIDEWVEATKLLPADDGGYDILAALNENRVWSGEQPLTSPESPRR